MSKKKIQIYCRQRLKNILFFSICTTALFLSACSPVDCGLVIGLHLLKMNNNNKNQFGAKSKKGMLRWPIPAAYRRRRRNASCVSFIVISRNKSKSLGGRSGECVSYFAFSNREGTKIYIKLSKCAYAYTQKCWPVIFLLSCRYSFFVAWMKEEKEKIQCALMMKLQGVRDVNRLREFLQSNAGKRKERLLFFVEYILLFRWHTTCRGCGSLKATISSNYCAIGRFSLLRTHVERETELSDWRQECIRNFQIKAVNQLQNFLFLNTFRPQCASMWHSVTLDCFSFAKAMNRSDMLLELPMLNRFFLFVAYSRMCIVVIWLKSRSIQISRFGTQRQRRILHQLSVFLYFFSPMRSIVFLSPRCGVRYSRFVLSIGVVAVSCRRIHVNFSKWD